MQETIGTLNLKIARLEQRLKVLEQQQMLSSKYPDQKAKLTIEYLRVQLKLRQLIQHRQELSLQPRLAA